MVYFDVKPLGDLIKEFYEQHRGAAYLDEVKVIESWPKVVGPFIASHTIDLSIKNHVLFVRVDSDALRSELLNNGWEHHFSMTYGDLTEELLALGRAWNIETTIVR